MCLQKIGDASLNSNEQQLLKLGEQLDKQRRLLQRVQGVYEAERREWVRLLHDDFGQSLAAIKSFAVGIKNSTGIASDTYDLAEIIQSTAHDLYESTYDLMRGLRSGFIEDVGLMSGIQVCIDSSRLSQQGIKVQVESEGEVESLSHFLNILLLRVVQESLSGIIRSSSPSSILISISRKQHNLAERRKRARNTVSTIELELPIRKLIEVHISSNGLDKLEFENYGSIFQRTQDYIEAFGGNYAIDQAENACLRINMKLDITDIIDIDNFKDEAR